MKEINDYIKARNKYINDKIILYIISATYPLLLNIILQFYLRKISMLDDVKKMNLLISIVITAIIFYIWLWIELYRCNKKLKSIDNELYEITNNEYIEKIIQCKQDGINKIKKVSLIILLISITIIILSTFTIKNIAIYYNNLNYYKLVM